LAVRSAGEKELLQEPHSEGELNSVDRTEAGLQLSQFEGEHFVPEAKVKTRVLVIGRARLLQITNSEAFKAQNEDVAQGRGSVRRRLALGSQHRRSKRWTSSPL
jgi:hypothetical protein